MAKRNNPDTTPEVWIPIMGYETRYVINESGVIKSLKREVHRRNDSKHIIPEIIKKQRITKFGYATCLLSINKKYKHHSVHVLVAKHFIGPKPGEKYQVNHKDGNKLNNHVTNLEWVTPSENLKHAFKNGLMCQKGENHASNKLNNKSVLKIFKSKKSVPELAKTYGVCNGSIYNIKSGVTWAHLTGMIHVKQDHSRNIQSIQNKIQQLKLL